MILVAEVLFALSIFAAISDNVSDPLVPLSSAPRDNPPYCRAPPAARQLASHAQPPRSR